MRKKKMKLIFSASSVVLLPLSVISCDLGSANSNTKIPGLNPFSGSQDNPNNNSGNNNVSAEKGFVLYKSDNNTNYLAKNTYYSFRDVSIDEQSVLPQRNDFNIIQNWKELIPRPYYDLPSEALFKVSVSDPITLAPTTVDFHLEEWDKYKNFKDKDFLILDGGFENAYKIWSALRKFSDLDYSINNYQNLPLSEFQNKYKDFVRTMIDYLEIDSLSNPSILKGLDSYSNINTKNDLTRKMISYVNSEFSFGMASELMLRDIQSQAPRELQDLFNYSIVAMKDEWDNFKTNASKKYYLPFTLSQIENIWTNSNMRINHENIYEKDNQGNYVHLKDIYGEKIFDAWDPLSSTFFIAIKFQTMEEKSKILYNKLMKFYATFIDFNFGGVKTNYFNLNQAIKDISKNAADELVNAIMRYINMKNITGIEMSSPDKEYRNRILALLFPSALGNEFDNLKADFEYTWRFAYQYLYDVLIPFYVVNNWELPKSFINYENNLNNKNSEAKYIYQYILTYLNTIFRQSQVIDEKHKNYKTLNLITNIQTRKNDSNFKLEQKAKVQKFLAHWFARLNLNISL